MPPILFALLALVILTLVSGLYVFLIGCVRKKDLPWLVEKEIQKTPYGKYYPFIVATDNWLRAHQAQDIYIESFDGLKLHGHWIPAENAKGTVLLAHGYRSTKLVDFCPVFDYYHRLGMNILVPDQRSHGESEGIFITFGVKESQDMLSWLAMHNSRYGACPVILSGISMGASTMLYLADRKLPDNVRGIVADCGFTSPREILASVYREVIHLPPGPSIWAAEFFARVFAGFSLTERDTRTILRKSHLPVLLIHGMDDGFVPCDMTRQAYAACTGQKQLLLVEGADHGVSVLFDPMRYISMITAFIKTNVEGFA